MYIRNVHVADKTITEPLRKYVSYSFVQSTNTHTYMCACTHTHTHTYMHTQIHTHTYTHAHTRTHMYTHIDTHTHAHTHACMQIHMHACTYECTHTHTHTHTGTNLFGKDKTSITSLLANNVSITCRSLSRTIMMLSLYHYDNIPYGMKIL